MAVLSNREVVANQILDIEVRSDLLQRTFSAGLAVAPSTRALLPKFEQFPEAGAVRWLYEPDR